MSVSTEWVSLRGYAKTLGVSPPAVSYAIKTGRIPDSAIRRGDSFGDGRQKQILINKAAADIAWNQSNNATHNKGKSSSGRISSKENTRKQNVPTGSDDTDEPQTRGITLSEAQRREKVAKAGITQLEFLQLQGKLIEKEVVYKQLFEGGQLLRNTMMSIPDRITAELASVGGNQNEIRRILTEAIASGLESVIDLYNAKLG